MDVTRGAEAVLPTTVIDGFELRRDFAKRDKAGYICLTRYGERKSVRKVALTAERVEYLHGVRERLRERGVWSDRFVTTREGVPYVADCGALYIAADSPPSGFGETCFDDGGAVLRAVKTAGAFHGALKGGEWCADVEETYSRAMNEIVTWRKFVGKQTRLSDFDVLFLKGYDDCAEGLGKWRELTSGASGLVGCVSHNVMKEEYMLTDGDQTLALAGTECCDGHFARDLASMVKRHVKRGVDLLPPRRIIDAYNAVNPMSADDFAVVKAELYYPDAFLDICRKWYAKKRTWTPVAFASRIEMIHNGRSRLRDYVDSFD